MRFFERQDDARQATWFLGLVTLLGAIAVAGSGGFLVAWLGIVHEAVDPASVTEASVLAGVAVLFVMLIVILIRRLMLGMNADQIPKMMGARRVTTEETDPTCIRLRNVVEEMALAAQMPVPHVHVIEDAGSIDAFAAGLAPEAASVTVTRGALESLTRDELQGVVAHEFSHIVNGDIRINLRLLSLVAGLRCFWSAGVSVVRFATRSAPGKNAVPAFLFATIFAMPLLWTGAFGVLFSRIMQAGISRQREHLADASAVQFTRNPGGLIGALEKAASLPGRAAGRFDGRGRLVSHMLFVGRRRGWFGLLATHPRIEKRIAALRAGFAE